MQTRVGLGKTYAASVLRGLRDAGYYAKAVRALGGRVGRPRRRRRQFRRNGRKGVKRESKLKMIPWPDLKYYDIGQITTPASTTGAFYLLNTIDQGVTQTTRIGNDIGIRKIFFRMLIQNNNDPESNHPVFFRCILFYCPQRVATPTSTTLLSAAQVEAPRNLSQAKDYRILYDEIIPVSSLESVAPININIDHKLPVRYNNATPTTAAHYDYGAIYFFVLSTVSDANTNIFWIPRTRFVDQ